MGLHATFPAILAGAAPLVPSTAGHSAAAQPINPNVPFWNIKPSLHINGVMRYRIWLNGRTYCNSNTYGGQCAVHAGWWEGCGKARLPSRHGSVGSAGMPGNNTIPSRLSR